MNLPTGFHLEDDITSFIDEIGVYVENLTFVLLLLRYCIVIQN